MQILVYKTYLQCELQILSFVRNICKIYMCKIDWNVRHKYFFRNHKTQICQNRYQTSSYSEDLNLFRPLPQGQGRCANCQLNIFASIVHVVQIQIYSKRHFGSEWGLRKGFKNLGIRNKNVYDPLNQSCPAGRVNDYFLGIPWNISNSKKIINSLSK